jgi:four helix bundle protein
MRDHRKLKAFALADWLALRIYAVTRKFPEEERFGLAAQMRRAAVSVAANIVEACARPSEADYLRQLAIAYASAKELQYQISLATRLGYIEAKSARGCIDGVSKLAKMLWALMNAIRAKPARTLAGRRL